jgi:hypothetical protein
LETFYTFLHWILDNNYGLLL